MSLLYFIICFLASIIGSLCGIGGGVIIKPVLDALGVMSVSTVSFLSGCTVLSMCLFSIILEIKIGNSEIEISSGTPLAIGAALGGIIGKDIFEIVINVSRNKDHIGALQAGILIPLTLGTLIFTMNASKIRTYRIKNRVLCVLIGLILGLISAFLGIGGGPINIIVLTFFFSMGTKLAAINSLYIIMFSQLTSFLNTLVKGTVPEFNPIVLMVMVFGGIAGAFWGKKINKKITGKGVNRLFMVLMIVIVGINIYNLIKFMN